MISGKLAQIRRNHRNSLIPCARHMVAGSHDVYTYGTDPLLKVTVRANRVFMGLAADLY